MYLVIVLIETVRKTKIKKKKKKKNWLVFKIQILQFSKNPPPKVKHDLIPSPKAQQTRVYNSAVKQSSKMFLGRSRKMLSC